MLQSGHLFCIKTDDMCFMQSGDIPDNCKQSGLFLYGEFSDTDFAEFLQIFHMVTRNEIILIARYEPLQEFLGLP